jgi:hypothetical protein
MSTVEIAPSKEVNYGNIGIRYFEADKEAKVKRHYEIREKLFHKTEDVWTWGDWFEVPSVTTAQGILHKEALIGWAQRVGAGGVVSLVNMKVLKPAVTPGGHEVLGFLDPERGGMVVVDEWEAVELLKKYGLAQHQVKEAGGERGQSVHDAFESYMRFGKLPDPSAYPIIEQGYVNALLSFLIESGMEPRACEVIVCSVEDGWAGRYDGDGFLPKAVELWTHRTEKGQGDAKSWFETGLYRVDVKTAKGPFPEHGEQLEAYEKGAIECQLPETVQRCVIHCAEDGRYRFVPVGSGQPRIPQYAWATYDDFRATLVKYRAMEARKGRRDG